VTVISRGRWPPGFPENEDLQVTGLLILLVLIGVAGGVAAQILRRDTSRNGRQRKRSRSDFRSDVERPPSEIIVESQEPFEEFFDSRATPKNFNVKAKRYFFSRAENAFFSKLHLAAVQRDLFVMSKVRLLDIFDSTKGTGSQSNYYGQKHVDFLILTRDDYRPVAGIELDGQSHQSDRQKKSDEVKDSVFKSAGLPLFRLSNGANKEEIEGIFNKIGENSKATKRSW
jgi:very-short-patch-repair endonuclease